MLGSFCLKGGSAGQEPLRDMGVRRRLMGPTQSRCGICHLSVIQGTLQRHKSIFYYILGSVPK